MTIVYNIHLCYIFTQNQMVYYDNPQLGTVELHNSANPKSLWCFSGVILFGLQIIRSIASG